MRLETYINEDFEDAVKYIVVKIRRECKPFLKEFPVSSKFLYRGTRMTNDHDGIQNKKRRKDRKPTDTPEDVTREIDNTFNSKFGWKPRTQGVFATGNSRTSTVYGIPHLFFPIGKYRYIWSPKIKDFYTHSYLDDFKSNYTHNYEGSKEEGLENWAKETVKLYKSKRLNDAAMSGNEIMFDVNRYYIIDRKYEVTLKRCFNEKI